MSALITNLEVKTLTILNSDFDETILTDNFILKAQETNLKYILTENLYYDLVINPTNYTDLINGKDYVYSGYNRRYLGLKKCLAYFVMVEALPFIWEQITGSGLYKNNRETSTSSALNEMEMAKGKLLILAQSEGDNIQKFIIENSNSYPLYTGFGYNLKDGFSHLNENLTGQKRIIGGMIL